MGFRINAIDLLRGIAIILMIQYHVFVYWTKMNYTQYDGIIRILGSLPAPLFLIISGMSFQIMIEKRIKDRLTKIEIFLDILKRATFIFVFSTLIPFLFGFILNINIPFIIYWNLFQLISFSMIIFFIIPFLRINLRMPLYISLSLLIFILRYVILFFEVHYLYILVEGVFPLISWANFYLFGMFFCDIFFNSLQTKININLLIILFIGITFLIFGASSDIFFIYFIMIIGVFFTLFSIFYYYLDIKERNPLLAKKLGRWGKLSFSLYYIHFGIIALGVIVLPQYFNEIYSNGITFFQYLLILLIFYIALEIFLILWEKFNYILGFEWIMNKFSKKSLFSEEN